jgi:predicted acyl esterase
MTTRTTVATLLVLSTVVVNRMLAQNPYDVKVNYTKSEHMVPMRDGVKLSTLAYVPVAVTVTWPIMISRTPYGVGSYGPDALRRSLGPSEAERFGPVG